VLGIERLICWIIGEIEEIKNPINSGASGSIWLEDGQFGDNTIGHKHLNTAAAKMIPDMARYGHHPKQLLAPLH